MKIKITTIFLFFSLFVIGQGKYNELDVIKAKTNKADWQIDNERVKGAWRIAPEIEVDSLFINCFNENQEFVFYTDIDSIKYNIEIGTEKKFYVLLNDKDYALTLIKGVKPNFKTLEFDYKKMNTNIKYWYYNNSNSYLEKLRKKYKIDSIIDGAQTDEEKTLRILHWVHNQWEHNGSNRPKKYDAISILEEAHSGKNFRCVEYGIVATACLNSIGLKARTIGLKTKDVETRKSGAGHVATEVFLNDKQKWIFLDGQWDIIPYLNDKPLNAVEFQKAISKNYTDLELKSYSDVSKLNYVSWIYQYLYYFDISFDNSGSGKKNRKIDNKRKIMLVPIGSKNPKNFQRWWMRITKTLYTNSIKDFYLKP
jgi:hypothetical protein